MIERWSTAADRERHWDNLIKKLREGAEESAKNPPRGGRAKKKTDAKDS